MNLFRFSRCLKSTATSHCPSWNVLLFYILSGLKKWLQVTKDSSKENHSRNSQYSLWSSARQISPSVLVVNATDWTLSLSFSSLLSFLLLGFHFQLNVEANEIAHAWNECTVVKCVRVCVCVRVVCVRGGKKKARVCVTAASLKETVLREMEMCVCVCVCV